MKVIAKVTLIFAQFIGDLVADIEDPESNEVKLKAFGRSHEELGIPKQYLEAVGPLFVQAIRPVLMTAASNASTASASGLPVSSPNSLWTRDTKPSWLRFFRVITLQMKRGYVNKVSQKTNEDK